ncbi:MAG: hypothetical protein WKF89_12845 [Chitinophagaceae bacterium]
MQRILQHLYKKINLQHIDVEAMQQLNQQSPYFAIGHYVLAKKLALEGKNDFQKQFQQTLLYFYNPLWLDHQLSEEEMNQATQPMVEEQPEMRSDYTADSAASHDLLEDVVLHQEIVLGSPGEKLDMQVPAINHTLTGRTADSSQEPAREEVKVAQQPERFSFQAYHTVDYFASQGIKLNQEVQANDKLGKQLKSFTEWLKTMRRLPESAAEEVLDKISDIEIVQFASDSLQEREVLTEAMAEVLVKQGKIEKARDVYQKLSLLHPHKIAYFAAKIEVLKQQ